MTSHYMPQLDGLRAVAVALVLVHHVAQETGFAGSIGVDVFFVLSGYLITGLLLTEWHRHGRVDLRRFYARRLLRLYPALLTLLVVCVVTYPWLSGSPGHYVKQAFFSGTYTGNIAQDAGLWLGPFGHTWSLALEEQFYLLWPLLLLAVPARVQRGWLSFALIASAVGSAVLFLWWGEDGHDVFNPLARSSGLLVGCAVALVRPRVPVTLAWVAAATMAVMLVASPVASLPASVYSVCAVAACAAVLGHLVSVDRTDPMARGLSARPLVTAGRMSYGIYLWHYPVTLMVAEAEIPWPLGLPIVALTTGILAAMSWRWVETPALRVKDRLRPQPAAPQAVV